MKHRIQSWMQGGCTWFTVLSLLLIVLKLLIAGGSANDGISLLSFLLLFPCGLCISFANLLARSKVLAPELARLFHFVILSASLFLFLWVPSGSNKTASSNLIALSVIVLLYWVAYLIKKLTVYRFRSIKEED